MTADPAGTPARTLSATDAGDSVLAPGWQGALFAAPLPARMRWRAVDPDGLRLPPVAQLGVAVAQALAIVEARGAAWIVGTDEHTVELLRTPTGPVVHGGGPAAPRWTAVVGTAVAPRTKPSSR